MFLYPVLLFILSLLGGLFPFVFKKLDERNMPYFLAFSGSFLFAVTVVHLIPESVEELGHQAGVFLLIGFFLQLFLQKFTHGAEHGHTHSDHGHAIPLTTLAIGMGLHAFMEGLPLGVSYRTHAAEPALFLAVAVHKWPEAMLISTIALTKYQSK